MWWVLLLCKREGRVIVFYLFQNLHDLRYLFFRIRKKEWQVNQWCEHFLAHSLCVDTPIPILLSSSLNKHYYYPFFLRTKINKQTRPKHHSGSNYYHIAKIHVMTSCICLWCKVERFASDEKWYLRGYIWQIARNENSKIHEMLCFMECKWQVGRCLDTCKTIWLASFINRSLAKAIQHKKHNKQEAWHCNESLTQERKRVREK